MKNMHLTFNRFTSTYFYYEAKDKNSSHRNRKELGSGVNLIKKLFFIDKKRKSTLYLKDIPKKIIAPIQNYFEDSRVVLEVKN